MTKNQITGKNLHYYDRKNRILHNRLDEGHAACTKGAHWHKLTSYLGGNVCDGVGGWRVFQWIASE